jgi:hypothetical protein
MKINFGVQLYLFLLSSITIALILSIQTLSTTLV